MPDAEIHQLPPLVRPERPVPVTVWDAKDKEWWPGFAVAWQGDRVSVEYSKGIGMKCIGWVKAAEVKRVTEFMQDIDSGTPRPGA